MKIILILISFIVIIGCIKLSLKYANYKKDKDKATVIQNEETISTLTYKISELFREFPCIADSYNYEEFRKYKKSLSELSKELLYIDSRNTERINEISNDIYLIEVALNTN